MQQIVLSAANILLPLAYLMVAIDYAFLFFAAHPVAVKTATPALRWTVALHLSYLVALATAVVYVFVEWRGRERSTGFWILSLVFLFQLLSSLLFHPRPPDRAIFHNPFFAFHVALALLGYAAFVVAAGYAFLFLQLYRDLKAGRFSTFFGKLPPLEVLERMMLGALMAGFVALTGALVTGALWAQQIYANWLHDPKILATLATWAIYGVALLLRRLRRWQGRQTALASLAGLCAILFSLVAVNLFLTGFHGFL